MSSYHIQDLRLVLPTPAFDLRVNKHYGKISAPFREWLQESLHGDVARAKELADHRFDLLCSLCFPTIDPPQLFRVSKLCALTFLADDGHVQAENSSSHSLTEYVPRVEPAFKALNRSAMHSGSTPYPGILTPEHFLEVARSMRTMQAQKLEHSTPGTNILSRFAGNLLSAFYSSKQTTTPNPHPGLLEFLAALENTRDRKFPEELINVALLATLWRCTINVVMWSQDLASYTSRHPQKCGRCAVCYSIEGQGFTLQGAVNDIRGSIQSEVGKFMHGYKSLTVRTCENEGAVTVAGAMRDCITGFIHWIYEGERYFGKRHGEVAKFGWIFTETSDTGTGGNEVDVS